MPRLSTRGRNLFLPWKEARFRVPKITRHTYSARVNARTGAQDHALDMASAGPTAGWCAVCYGEGQYTLAAEPSGRLCAFHSRLSGPPPCPAGPGTSGPPCRRPAAQNRAKPDNRRPSTAGGPGRAGRVGAERVSGPVLARGRRRAAARVNAGGFAPHPGWRNFIPAGRVVLVDQPAALRRVDQLLAGQSWRADRFGAWLLVLRALIHAMDWETGLVTGVTLAQLAAAGGRSERTVSAVLRWAKDVGLLVVVEPGASATFLGAKHNRTPTYALLAAPDPGSAGDGQPAPCDGLADQADHGLCDLPQSPVGKKPLLRGRRLDTPHPLSWPSWRIPKTPSQRNAAASALARRIGLDRPGVAGWRLRALLERGGWWREGWCVAGLLYALDHHPDHLDQPRGDALHGATDPIRVLGHRLRPWRGRLTELPNHLYGQHDDQLIHARRERVVSAERARAADAAARERGVQALSGHGHTRVRELLASRTSARSAGTGRR